MSPNEKERQKVNKIIRDNWNTCNTYSEVASLCGLTADVTRKRGIRMGLAHKPKIKVNNSNIKQSAELTLANKLIERYTEDELKILLKSQKPTLRNDAKLSFEGYKLKIGIMGDLHLGSSYTNPAYVLSAFKKFKEDNCEFICITGDITEGLSHRPDHVYQCSHIGYTAQKKHAIEILSQSELPMYLISGNHDRWYIKNSGANIVEDICQNVKNCNYLGHDEGNIVLNNNSVIKLWHGEDMSSYAMSYRVQKLIESFTGGEKPNVLLTGHTHKSFYIYDRHIHAISTGAIQKQTPFLRAKKIAVHTGFWEATLTLNSKGISSIITEWFPLYV